MSTDPDDDCGLTDDEIANMVEHSLEPEDDLPAAVLRAAVDFVFSNADEHAARGAADVLEALCIEADDTDGRSVEELIATSEELSLLEGGDGAWVVGHEKDEDPVELPPELRSTFEELVLGADGERHRRVAALDELANRWVHLLLEYEAMVGHLILRYGLTSDDLADAASYYGALKDRILESPVPPNPTFFGDL